MPLHVYLQRRTQEKRIVSYAPTLWDSFFAVQHHCKLRKEGSIFPSVPMPQAIAIISNNVIRPPERPQLRILSAAPIKRPLCFDTTTFFILSQPSACQSALCHHVVTSAVKGRKNRYYSTRLRLIFPPPAKRACESLYAVISPHN